MPRITQGQSIAEAAAIAEDLERERCIQIARKVRAKWQRIVNYPRTTVIGGACAAASVEAADEIIKAMRANEQESGDGMSRAEALEEAIRRTRTRLEFYCNEANAGRMPSDAREFMRRVQCGFDSLFEEAATIEALDAHGQQATEGEK